MSDRMHRAVRWLVASALTVYVVTVLVLAATVCHHGACS